MNLYKKLAQHYDLLYSYRDYGKEADFLINCLDGSDSPRLLDVACGTGTHLKAVRERLPSAGLVGIDLNQGMLDVAGEKGLDARLVSCDMRDFNLAEEFDLVYCLSSSIQYNLSEDDLIKSLSAMARHTPLGKVIFDLAFCTERWKEGYTNVTANSNERYEVAEIYTSHSQGSFSHWNPLYLIKDKETGEMDMHVDKHVIKIWGIDEVEQILRSNNMPYTLRHGFSEPVEHSGVPIFILEGFKS